MRYLMLRLFLILLALFSLSAVSADEWIRTSDRLWCKRTSSTFVMRDPVACGTSQTVFCITPIDCYASSGSSWFKSSTGFASCRALRPPAAASLTCPSLQGCADDPNPELDYEHNLYRWRRPRWSYEDVIPAPVPLHKGVADDAHDD